MTLWEDREHAFEAKFAHDAEMKFRAEARRNKLLGLWAAELLGKDGEDAANYARDVIKADFEQAGDEDVFRKLKDDIGHIVEEGEIRAKMEQMRHEAKSQLLEEY